MRSVHVCDIWPLRFTAVRKMGCPWFFILGLRRARRIPESPHGAYTGRALDLVSLPRTYSVWRILRLPYAYALLLRTLNSAMVHHGPH